MIALICIAVVFLLLIVWFCIPYSPLKADFEKDVGYKQKTSYMQMLKYSQQPTLKIFLLLSKSTLKTMDTLENRK